MTGGPKLEIMTHFLAMLTATAVWMTVPQRIVYRESSPMPSPVFSVEVTQHGTSFFVTPAQKKTSDRISNGTPVVWFGAFGGAVAAISRARSPVTAAVWSGVKSTRGNRVS